jgi:aromatic-L-amino-acid/L-tryptophan decarboxylase
VEPEELRRLGHRMVDLLVEHLAADDAARAWKPFPNDRARRMLDEPLPEHGEPADAILDRFAAELLPYAFGNGHPGFWGWVNGPPAEIGVLADALAAAMNPSVAGGNHAATYVEHEVLGWLKDLVGFPRAAGGVLVSGGTAATLTALAVARHRASGGAVRSRGVREELCVYTSTEGHSAIARAVEALGLGSERLRRLPVDDDWRLRLQPLREAIERDRADGRIPMAVAVSAGTVNTGAVDPLAEVAELCEELGVWMHVDGAYGAPAILDERHRADLGPLTRADSLALDPHKWLNVPYAAGAVLVRDAELMRSAFTMTPAYLQVERDPEGVGWLPWFSEYGLEQTRPFRALKVWMTMRHLGRAGFAANVGRDLDHAALLARLVDEHPELELVAHGLSIVCLRCAPPGVADLDELNRAVLRAVQHSGEAFLSSTVLDGRFVLRACFVNPRTTEAHVRRAVELIARLAAEAP